MPQVVWISSSPARPWQERKPAGAPPRPTADLCLTGGLGQTWEGFGGCFNEMGWDVLRQLPAAARQRVLRLLFHPATGCRCTVNRLPVGASDFALAWYSHNEHPGDLAMRHFSVARDREYLLPYIKAALALRPDMTLFASPWSPPTWMKDPAVYNYGTLVRRPEIMRAYALYLVRFVQAYQRLGVPIHQIHPQNEPAADQKFPSCLWTGAQLRDFIRDHLGPAFAAHGIRSEIWLGTINSGDYNGFAHTVLQDPRARQHVAGVAYQYNGRMAIQRTHLAWPTLRLMQSENECGDGTNTWEYAHYVFSLMVHYLNNGANAYVYWNMVLPPGGRSTWGWAQNAMITVDPLRRRVSFNPEFYLMRHCGQCIDPGARRVVVSGSWAGNAVAFVNPDGSRVAVLNNPLPDARTIAVAADGRRYTLRLEPNSFHTLVIKDGFRHRGTATQR